MQVTVQYVGQLRRAAGTATDTVTVEPGTTLRALLDYLADHHDGAFRELLLGNGGNPHPSLLFFVGDQPAEPTCALHDSDAVTVLMPMAGG